MTQLISLTSSPENQARDNSRVNVSASLKTLGTLTLLLLALPFNATLVLVSLVFSILRPPLANTTNSRNILISGGKMTKALQLARSFHAAGHRVTLIESHKYWLTGHRFSRSVSKFYTVTAPEKNPEAYIESLVDIVKRDNIDVYVPVCSPVASYYDSLAKKALSSFCEVIHCDAEITQMLDDKYAFAETARSFGLSVPKSFKITDPEQVINFDFSQEQRKYILKSIPYDSVRRLNLTKLPCDTKEATAAFVRSLPISPEKPWIMQEFIPGKEYCTHSTVRDGVITLHCCCESSAFQVNYENVDNPQIFEWVSHFVKQLGITGQVSFDFIQASDGNIYAIECNPRTHSAITMFYNHPGVAEAYLSTPSPQGLERVIPIQPLPTSKPTFWTYHEIWRLVNVRSWSDLVYRLQVITRGTDAIFSWQDPLPFLMVHHWQIFLLLIQNLQKNRGWIRIDFNIGKLVELGGD
ncbi:MAG: ATP-grasp domain-containing protein [Calothrix sp. C42_A2020_038]|nr:ATP-grasp domain-containing protein [Calothrix sp. C42_A2020_038]